MPSLEAIAQIFGLLLSWLGATLLQDSAAFLHLIALSLKFSMHEDTTPFINSYRMTSI